MKAEELPALQAYIENSIGTMTTRHASETQFECPAIPSAVAAEQQMRATLHALFDSYVIVSKPNSHPTHLGDLAEVKADYWEEAQLVTPAHGTKPNFRLDDYFHTGQDRHYNAIRASITKDYDPFSIPVIMLAIIDKYQKELGLDVVNATRILMNLFNTQLPAIKRSSAYLQAEGVDASSATSHAVTEFTTVVASNHVSTLKTALLEGLNVSALINKSSLYPETTDKEFDAMPLRMSRKNAEGIAKVYHLQERPYAEAELALADKLMQAPAMQMAILLLHRSMIEYASGYLTMHPERAQYSLEPFSEIFVPLSTPQGLKLMPNPKLIKVIGNNTMPAIARVLMKAGTNNLGVLTGEHIEQGIELAKKLRVFHTKIGKFNNYDPETDTVELASLFDRICPAMQIFSRSLAAQLPRLYEAARQQYADLSC